LPKVLDPNAKVTLWLRKILAQTLWTVMLWTLWTVMLWDS
jgi:hypothetical protein